MEGDKERGEEASKGGNKIGREGSKRVFGESSHFLARKQNLLEAPTQQMYAYACLAQLAT